MAESARNAWTAAAKLALVGFVAMLPACADQGATGQAAPEDSSVATTEDAPRDAAADSSTGLQSPPRTGPAPEIIESPAPSLAGGLFGFSYPNFFTGAGGVATATGFVERFAGMKHNPSAYDDMIAVGTDVRKLNRKGIYVKHINLRTLDNRELSSKIEGRPDYAYIHANHPEWIVRDSTGAPVPLFLPTEEVLDFGNDAYLDWALNTWMPAEFFDSTDTEPGTSIWLQHDNGAFDAMSIHCASGDPICNRYVTDEGVRTAWEHMLTRIVARWPQIRIIVSTGPVTYKPVDEQLPVFERILSKTDGYYSECLTNRHCYWSTQPTKDIRVAMSATMALARWLADNGKVFMPIDGQNDTTEPSQDDTNYSWAFFNLLRRGDRQFYSKVTKDASGQWVPRDYPEMDRPLGRPLEEAVQTSPDVYRRTFERAIAFVNLSDGTVSIDLPATATYETSLGAAVVSPLVLTSLSGSTIYVR